MEWLVLGAGYRIEPRSSRQSILVAACWTTQLTLIRLAMLVQQDKLFSWGQVRLTLMVMVSSSLIRISRCEVQAGVPAWPSSAARQGQRRPPALIQRCGRPIRIISEVQVLLGLCLLGLISMPKAPAPLI